MMHRLALFCLCLIVSGCVGSGPRPLLEMPYQPDGSLIMLPVSLNGASPQLFMLDSGASHSVIDPRLARETGLRVVGAGTTTGTGAGGVAIQHAAAATLTIGAFILDVPEPWLIDLSGVPIDARVRGLIGAELFKRYAVRLDPAGRRIAVYESGAYWVPAGTASVPLIVEGDRLFIDARLDIRPGVTVTRRLRVDVGSASSVNDPAIRQAATVRTTELGGGLGANYQGVSGRIDGVQIGPYRIREVWGPAGERPAIGMELLRRFTVIFDAPAGRMWLRPNDAFSEPVPAPE